MRALLDDEYLNEAYSRELEEKGPEMGLEMGCEEDREEGREANQQENAISMLKDHMSHELVSKYTGLSMERVNQLAEQKPA